MHARLDQYYHGLMDDRSNHPSILSCNKLLACVVMFFHRKPEKVSWRFIFPSAVLQLQQAVHREAAALQSGDLLQGEERQRVRELAGGARRGMRPRVAALQLGPLLHPRVPAEGRSRVQVRVAPGRGLNASPICWSAIFLCSVTGTAPAAKTAGSRWEERSARSPSTPPVRATPTAQVSIQDSAWEGFLFYRNTDVLLDTCCFHQSEQGSCRFNLKFQTGTILKILNCIYISIWNINYLNIHTVYICIKRKYLYI